MDTTTTADQALDRLNLNEGAEKNILGAFLPALIPHEKTTRAACWHFAAPSEATAAALAYMARGDVSLSDNIRDLVGMVASGRTPSGLAGQVAKIRDAIEAAAPSKPRMRGLAVAGAFPSVPRYLSGLPDCMAAPVRVAVPRIITLAMNTTMGGDTAIAKTCAVIAAVSERIEASGCRVRLVVTNRSYQPTAAIQTVCDVAVMVKEPDQHVDPGLLAYWSGHPDTYQGVLWACKLGDPRGRAHGARLGNPYTAGWKSDPARDVFVFPSLPQTLMAQGLLGRADWDAPQNAERVAVAYARGACIALKAQGVPVEFNPD